MANCTNCSEKCPHAEMAHQIALGRMYATKELVELIKKIEKGELVEVVRCRDCKYSYAFPPKYLHLYCERLSSIGFAPEVNTEDFCSYGERRNDNAAD